MKNAIFAFGLLLSAAYACSSDAGREMPPPQDQAPVSEAQRIVDAAIAAHGLERVDGRRIEFDFRGRHYVSERRGGDFTYERIFTDSTGRKIRDVLTNEGFHREVDGKTVALEAKDSAAYANSVNSVLYFALLPYHLNDPPVRKEYLGEADVRGEAVGWGRLVWAGLGRRTATLVPLNTGFSKGPVKQTCSVKHLGGGSCGQGWGDAQLQHAAEHGLH